MRQTKQKESLNRELKSFTSFFNAEELYIKVSSKDIGIATVYRFLQNCVKEGKLHSYQCNRRTIYSASKKNHSHFICEVCGVVKHLNLTKLDFLKEQIKDEVCHVQIDVTGICEKCR